MHAKFLFPWWKKKGNKTNTWGSCSRKRSNFHNQTLQQQARFFLLLPEVEGKSKHCRMHSEWYICSYPISVSCLRPSRKLLHFIFFLLFQPRWMQPHPPSFRYPRREKKNFFFPFFSSLWDVNVIYNILFSYQSFGFFPFSSLLGVYGYLWWCGRDGGWGLSCDRHSERETMGMDFTLKFRKRMLNSRARGFVA